MRRLELTPLLRKQAGHERVIAALKHSLAEGHYEGGMLPPYRQIARDLDVTRANVERAMAELEREGLIRRENGRGVFPCAQPRSVVSRKRFVFQCVNIVRPPLSETPSFVEADYLKGYAAALQGFDVQLRSLAWSEVGSDYDRVFSPALSAESQGVLLVNWSAPEAINWLRRNDVPFVVQHYNRYKAEHLQPHFSIYVNKAGGAFRAVSHLLELGHRNIGFVGDVNQTDSVDGDIAKSATVFEGYRSALICAGLECVKENLACCNTKEKLSVFPIVKSFLDRSYRPSAILASCDEIALGLLDAAHALNIRVPEELSIVGFDNDPISEQNDPPLTTVSVPRRELAKGAIELLAEAAEKPRVPPRTCILDTHLLIRGTTAPPGAIRI